MPAANDNFGNAEVITGASGTVAFNLTGATTETSEPFPGNGETVWFAWTAPASGTFWFDTMLSAGDPDTAISVYTGTAVSSLTLIATDDDSGNNPDVGNPAYGASKLSFVASGSTTYNVQVDGYGTGLTGTLRWGTTEPTLPPPPPPPPTATGWTEAAGRAFHTAFPGDVITVTGTHLDVVTDVTINGFPQTTFTAPDSTHLTVTVGTNARSGPIQVSNSSGSATPSGDVTILFYGPWIQPPDATATLDSGHFFGSTYGNDLDSPVRSTTQPDFTGSPLVNSGAATLMEVSSATLDPNWDWNFRGGVVSLDARDPTQTMPTTDPSVFFDGSGTEWDYEFEADHGTALTDPVISFDARVEYPSGNHVEDTSDRSLSEDLWQTTMQFRRLPGSDWTYDSYDAYLLSGAWPSPSALAALPLDSEQPTLDPGATLQLTSLTGADGAPYTDNFASLIQGTDPGYVDPQTVTWADFGDSRAWAFSFDPFIDGTALTPPFVSPTAYATGNALHRKLITGLPYVRATWTYRPARYRIIYTEPPLLTIPPLRQWPRDDGLRRNPGRTAATSRQGSLRRGPRGTYT